MASQPAREKLISVFVPEGFSNFECGMCGQCCVEPGRIVISRAKYEKLARVLRSSNFPYPVPDALMCDESAADEPVAFALVGDRCVFLDGESRCRLCSLDVPEMRGIWCVSFPVSPVITPRGVNYSISFACPKTAKMLSRRKPLRILALSVPGPAVPALDRAFPTDHLIPTRPDRPDMDWTAYQLIEGMLLAVAQDEELSASHRMLVMHIMLGDLLGDYQGPESDEALRERVSNAAQRLPEMAEQAKSAPENPVRHYEAIASLFGRRVGLRSRTRLNRVVEQAMRVLRGRRTKTTADELGHTLAEIYRKHYRPKARTLDHTIANYVICRIFANREILDGGVYKGLFWVYYLVALVKFFAATTAAEKNKSVDEEGLRQAIQTVEKCFVQSRTAFDFLDSHDEKERMLSLEYAAALVKT